MFHGTLNTRFALAPRHLVMLASLLGLGLLGCDDDPKPAAIDVLIDATPESGNAPLAVSFEVRHTGPLDGTFTYAWDFGDGSTETQRSPTHTFEAGGDFVVSVSVQSGGSRGRAEITLKVAGPVDLSVRSVSATPQRVQAGGEVRITGGIQNAGDAIAGAWRLVVVASLDRVIDDGDRVLFESARTGDPMKPLESFDEVLTLPADLASGAYQVALIVDADEVLGDTNRDNNVAFSGVPIEVRNRTDDGPDLVVCELSVPGLGAVAGAQRGTVQQGDQVQLIVCIGNTGNRPVIDGSVEVFLSRDPSPSDDDLSVLRRDGLDLGTGDTLHEEILIDVPLDLETGAWYFVAIVDGASTVEEQSEDNNERALVESFDVVAPGEVAGIDLVVSVFTATGTSPVFWGQTVDVNLVLTNRGQTAVERPFVLRIVAEPSDGRAGDPLTSINLDGLAAGASSELNAPVTITRRIQPGEYCLVAHADPTGSVDDANPANNRRRSSCFTLGGMPDLDPAVSGVTFLPLEIDAGQVVTVDATVSNIGVDATGGLEVAVVFSSDAELGGAGKEAVVLTQMIDPIAAGADVPLSMEVTVPDDLDRNVGVWFVAVVVDPGQRVTTERSEDNNVAFAEGTLRVNGAQGGCPEDNENEENDAPAQAQAIGVGLSPMLALCDAADWFEVEVPAGQILRVTLVAPGEVPTLEARSVDDQVLALGNGALDTRVALVPPSVEARSVRLGITSAIEAPYTLSVEVYAASIGPDLAVSEVDVAPARGGPGQPIAVDATVFNLGTAQAPPTTMGIYIVAPGAVPDAASRSGEVQVPAMGVGERLVVGGEALVADDSANGAVQVVVIADDLLELAEDNEGDNEARADFLITDEDLCLPDALEPNGSPHEAELAGRAAAVAAGVYPDLAVCVGDDDWYAIALMPGQGARVSIAFVHDAGDVDMRLYEADGLTSVDQSTGVVDSEEIVLDRSVAGGIYYLRVYLLSFGEGPTSNLYALTVELFDGGLCEDDAFEPNASLEAAQAISDGVYVLNFCSADEDWYRFSIVAGNDVSFRLQSDLPMHLYLYDANENLLDDDDRIVAWEAVETGAYALRVTGPVDEAGVYSLTVRGASGVDLEVTSLMVTPVIVTEQQEVRARAEVRNALGDRVENVDVRFVLSRDEVPSADDVVLSTQVLPIIDGVEVVAVTARLRIPPGAGERFVVAEIDPFRRAPDASRANNNRANAIVVRAACLDDDPRSNEGPATATELQSAVDGVICAHTEDWYRVEATVGRQQFGLEFDAALGDLDLTVLDAELQVLAESATDGAPESVDFQLDADGPIFIRVDGFLDAEAAYSLSILQP